MNKLTDAARNEQEKEITKQSAKLCYRKLLITILVILLIEIPQVISAWISIVEILPQLHRQELPVIQLIKKPAK